MPAVVKNLFYDVLGYEHAEHANIIGDALQSIQDDPSVQSAQGEVLKEIANLPQYGEESFSLDHVHPQPFTANGPTGNWVEAAITGNQAFWTVHSATISIENVTVSADGTTTGTWHIHDDFDFIPGPDHSLSYNIVASLVQPFYNGLLAAKKSYPFDVYWDQTHPPQKKNSIPR